MTLDILLLYHFCHIQRELYLFVIRLMCIKAKLVPKNNEGDQVRVINFSPYTLTMGGENQDTERASKEVTLLEHIASAR